MGIRNRKKRAQTPETSGNSRWQIVYTGFILILLTFFIMLSSFSTVEEAKVMRFVRAFSNAVNVFTGGLNVTPGSTVLAPSPEIVNKESHLARLLQNITLVAGRIGLTEVELAITEKGVVMTLPDATLFDSGVANLTPRAVSILEKVTRILISTDVPVRIEGHTDDHPIRNDLYPSNWELSVTRAVNVLRYFTEVAGIDAGRLSAVGFGEYHPVAPNSSEENRAGNRRVEIVFIQD